MRRSSLSIAAILVLLVASLAWGEDRIEKIADSKGYKELIYRGDALAEQRSFDLQGAILEETTMDSSALPLETRSYIREKGRIVRVEARDGAGNSTGAMSYRYDRYGRLLGVDAQGSLGLGSAGMITSRALPQGAWVSGSSSSAKPLTRVLAYDLAGRPTSLQTLLDGSPVTIENRSYGVAGLLSAVHSEDRVKGLSSDFSYDDKARVSLRTDTPAKGPKTKTEYSYDDSGRLSVERSFGQGHPLSKTYAYAEDNSLARVETRRDGLLLLVVVFIENGRQEELYEEGNIFVRATYKGGRKTKDEFFADGVSARTRTY